MVYPPLCAVSAADTRDVSALLEEEDVRLITQDGTGYAIRFRVAELWGELFSPAGD